MMTSGFQMVHCTQAENLYCPFGKNCCLPYGLKMLTYWLCLYLFTTCSTSSLSMSLPICAGPNPSGVSGGEGGDVGEGGALVTGDAGVKLSATGPLLDVFPLVTVGVAKYFLLLRFRRTRLFKIKSQGLLSNVSNSFSVSILT